MIVIEANDMWHIDGFPLLNGQYLYGVWGHEIWLDLAGQDLTLEQEQWLKDHPKVKGWMKSEKEPDE